jgi:hypothetical protein
MNNLFDKNALIVSLIIGALVSSNFTNQFIYAGICYIPVLILTLIINNLNNKQHGKRI